MIKADIVTTVSKKTGYSKRIVDIILNSTLDSIANAVASGEKVQFAGFGTFEPKARASRVARNPRSGESIIIPARVLPVFRAGKGFKDIVEEIAKTKG